MCQYCGDSSYCKDSNKDPIKMLSTLCNGNKTCRVKGQEFLNLSETCMGIRTYIQLAYNCTKGNLDICFNIQKSTTSHSRAKPPTCRWQTFSSSCIRRTVLQNYELLSRNKNRTHNFRFVMHESKIIDVNSAVTMQLRL